MDKRFAEILYLVDPHKVPTPNYYNDRLVFGGVECRTRIPGITKEQCARLRLDRKVETQDSCCRPRCVRALTVADSNLDARAGARTCRLLREATHYIDEQLKPTGTILAYWKKLRAGEVTVLSTPKAKRTPNLVTNGKVWVDDSDRPFFSEDHDTKQVNGTR